MSNYSRNCWRPRATPKLVVHDPSAACRCTAIPIFLVIPAAPFPCLLASLFLRSFSDSSSFSYSSPSSLFPCFLPFFFSCHLYYFTCFYCCCSSSSFLSSSAPFTFSFVPFLILLRLLLPLHLPYSLLLPFFPFHVICIILLFSVFLVPLVFSFPLPPLYSLLITAHRLPSSMVPLSFTFFSLHLRRLLPLHFLHPVLLF